MSDNDNYFKDIENTIKNYLSEKNTDYGIMLTGEWGAGKTYYVKNNYKGIYVSVAGKNTIDDIIYDISISGIFDIPKKDSDCPNIKAINNVNKMALKIFKPIIKYTNNILEEHIIKILSDVSNNSIEINNILLIIDDLERLSKNINIEDFLYSMYDNFIMNNIKVLFICNEEVLINNDEYNKIKEKIIRHTIKLHSIDINNFKLFLEKYIIKNLIDDKYIKSYYINNNFFYKQCIPNIINIFIKMKCYNIRTFKKFFDMSKFFLNEINNFIDKKEYKLKNNKELFLYILEMFSIVVIAHDKGILDKSIFTNKETFDNYQNDDVVFGIIGRGFMKDYSYLSNNLEEVKLVENTNDFFKMVLNLKFFVGIDIIFYFYKYLECGVLDFKQIYLIYKPHIYFE